MLDVISLLESSQIIGALDEIELPCVLAQG